MRHISIVESYSEPDKNVLWFYKGQLKWFSTSGWENVNITQNNSQSTFNEESNTSTTLDQEYETEIITDEK